MPREYVRTPYPKLGETVGLYQVCTSANTDYPITVPAGAKMFTIHFRTSTSDATLVQGRIAIGNDNTAITPITASSTNMGTLGPMVYQFDLNPTRSLSGGTWSDDAIYIHVANSVAGAVAVGAFFFV